MHSAAQLITLGRNRLIRRRRLSAGSLNDLHPGARTDARGSGFDHGIGVFERTHSTRRLDTHMRADGLAHQLHAGAQKGA